MRLLAAITVFALALPLAAQELPSAPSATKQQAQLKAQAADKFQVSTNAMSPLGAGAAGPARPWNGLQPQNTPVTDHRTGGFVSKMLAPLVGGGHSDGNKPQTFGGRVMGAVSKMADIDDEPADARLPNYSQFLGMSVSDTIANAYLPLNGRGMRHGGGGFGAHVGANTGLNLVGEFLPGVKRFLAGHKAPQRQREALSWRTGGQNAPSSLH